MAKKQNNPSWRIVVEVIMIPHVNKKNASKFMVDFLDNKKRYEQILFQALPKRFILSVYNENPNSQNESSSLEYIL